MCQTKEFHVIEGLSGFIYSHEPYDQVSYRPNRNCFIVLQTLKDYKIRIEAVEFLVEGVPNQCKGDTLHLFDLDKPRTTDATDGPGPIIGQICGKVKNRTLLATSTYNAMTLWWHTDSVLEKYKGGFILKWTAFRNSDGITMTEFQCGNGMCIPRVLACDDVLHCPDGSDTDRSLKLSIGCESRSPATSFYTSLFTMRLQSIRWSRPNFQSAFRRQRVTALDKQFLDSNRATSNCSATIDISDDRHINML
ncbi:unnamed protein product [Soboliphyme baturini]|uniref:CUB domain-containing protein n=1 Tax=Soboliphyme baturini TaxID=241478 RepID=A0A3P8DPA8_9BILA|nr:unnamed protein product [Soboliphyme baturini]